MMIPVANAELNCVTRGAGPVCLVLSTIGTKPYERQIPTALDAHLTLAFVDVRGSGRSTGDPTGLTFDVLADDLDAVRVALGVPRVAVLGHSAVGMLAVEYARRRPETISHAIIVGTPPRGDMAALVAASTAYFQAHASDERKRLLQENLAKLSPETAPAQAVYAQTPLRFFDPRFDAPPLFAGAETRPGVLKHLLGTLAPTWDITAGTALRTPLLIAHGRHDYTVPHGLWDGVLPGLPNATMVLFERSGHQPFVEEPERFATEVVAWLRVG
ncbi:MAG TPA: alpha/beta hydrolase [Polyangia bacterium]|jgi:proline iminopeptidase|nr:alpha/beta hydrolase [Polyangia bacterium]